MPKNLLNIEEKTDIIKWYTEFQKVKNYNCIVNVQKNFQQKYNKTPPSKPTIISTFKNYKNYGNVENRNKGSVHKKTVITEENILKVKNILSENSSTSIRKIATQTNINRESVRKIMKYSLKLFPYKIQFVAKIPDSAINKRLNFSLKMLEINSVNSSFIDNIWFTDESHFYIDGYINKQNWRIWGSEKPEVFVEKTAHPKYVTVWCALSSKGLIGPYFFENSEGERQTVNQQNYQSMIKNFFVPQLKEKFGDNLSEHIFCQDGASCHTSKSSLELLKTYFGTNIISNKTENYWPPYSPDLNPCDFFLWGFLKDNVFKETFKNCDSLKQKIIDCCEKVTLDLCKNSIENFKFRLQYCVSKKGKHFSLLMKKSHPLHETNSNVINN
jgi:hypothetical protein